jgi:hypothetical protein
MNIYSMKKDSPEQIEGRIRNLAWAKRHGICFAGLYATDDLASINGVHIQFFITPETTPQQLDDAKDDAHRKRDVVGFSALMVTREFLEGVGT